MMRLLKNILLYNELKFKLQNADNEQEAREIFSAIDIFI